MPVRSPEGLRVARNIELKARDPDPASSLQLSVALGVKDEGWPLQLDTYSRTRATEAPRAGRHRRADPARAHR